MLESIVLLQIYLKCVSHVIILFFFDELFQFRHALSKNGFNILFFSFFSTFYNAFCEMF